MKKKVLMILFCGVLLFGITGCGGDKAIDYSDGIKEQRSGTVLILGDHNFGEYLDYSLEDYKWSENENYQGKNGNGSITVTGKDKKTGNKMEIVWVKEVTQGGALSNLEYIKCDGKDTDYMDCDNTEYSYQKFLSYLLEYKTEVEEYYQSK